MPGVIFLAFLDLIPQLSYLVQYINRLAWLIPWMRKVDQQSGHLISLGNNLASAIVMVHHQTSGGRAAVTLQ